MAWDGSEFVYAHGGVAVETGKLSGDLRRLKVESWGADGRLRWEKVGVDGARPTMRAAHSVLFDKDAERLLIWGGRTETDVGDRSLWAFSLRSSTWALLSSSAASPAVSLRPPLLLIHRYLYVPINGDGTHFNLDCRQWLASHQVHPQLRLFGMLVAENSEAIIGIWQTRIQRGNEPCPPKFEFPEKHIGKGAANLVDGAGISVSEGALAVVDRKVQLFDWKGAGARQAWTMHSATFPEASELNYEVQPSNSTSLLLLYLPRGLGRGAFDIVRENVTRSVCLSVSLSVSLSVRQRAPQREFGTD